MQDLTNSQSLNRYSYVLNNPLSLTDPTGFFFGSIFKAIGNFFGKIFSGIFSALKSALKIPLIRGIIQIVACSGAGPIGIGACVAATGALSALAGGSLADTIKAMAFASAQIGAWWETGNIIAGSGLVGGAKLLFSTGLHGVVGGALSIMQGGTFVAGLASSAFSEATQPFTADLPEGLDVAGSAIVGGTASVLTGGKFVNGAVTGAFATMYNDVSHMLAGTDADRTLRTYLQGRNPGQWTGNTTLDGLFGRDKPDLIYDPLDGLGSYSIFEVKSAGNDADAYYQLQRYLNMVGSNYRAGDSSLVFGALPRITLAGGWFGSTTYTYTPGKYRGTISYTVDNRSVFDEIRQALSSRPRGTPLTLPLPSNRPPIFLPAP